MSHPSTEDQQQGAQDDATLEGKEKKRKTSKRQLESHLPPDLRLWHLQLLSHTLA